MNFLKINYDYIFNYTWNCSVDRQWRSTKINAYKRGIGIINDDHQQDGNRRRSSLRESLMCGMNINMGNASYIKLLLRGDE